MLRLTATFTTFVVFSCSFRCLVCFSTFRSFDRTLVSRIEKTGYKYSAAGENVAMGQSTAQRVMTAWLNSEGHRRNIESKDFDEIGVGLV